MLGALDPASLGRPYPGRRVALLDDALAPVALGEPGQIAVAADDPVCMLGLLERPGGDAAQARRRLAADRRHRPRRRARPDPLPRPQRRHHQERRLSDRPGGGRGGAAARRVGCGVRRGRSARRRARGGRDRVRAPARRMRSAATSSRRGCSSGYGRRLAGTRIRATSATSASCRVRRPGRSTARRCAGGSRHERVARGRRRGDDGARHRRRRRWRAACRPRSSTSTRPALETARDAIARRLERDWGRRAPGRARARATELEAAVADAGDGHRGGARDRRAEGRRSSRARRARRRRARCS